MGRAESGRRRRQVARRHRDVLRTLSIRLVLHSLERPPTILILRLRETLRRLYVGTTIAREGGGKQATRTKAGEPIPKRIPQTLNERHSTQNWRERIAHERRNTNNAVLETRRETKREGGGPRNGENCDVPGSRLKDTIRRPSASGRGRQHRMDTYVAITSSHPDDSGVGVGLVGTPLLLQRYEPLLRI